MEIADDQAKADTSDFIKMIMKNHADPKKKEILSGITK